MNRFHAVLGTAAVLALAGCGTASTGHATTHVTSHPTTTATATPQVVRHATFTAPPAGQATGGRPDTMACQALSMASWRSITGEHLKYIGWIWSTHRGLSLCNSTYYPPLPNGQPDATVMVGCSGIARIMGGAFNKRGRVYSRGKDTYIVTTGGTYLDVQGSWASDVTAAKVRAAFHAALAAVPSLGCPG